MRQHCRLSHRIASPPGNDRHAALDKLLGALKTAPSEEIAGPLEEQIRQLWLNSGTPAITLLMSRGLREMKAEARQDAIEDFSAAITLDPNLAEAYHQRAIARFTAGDTQVRSPTFRRRCSMSHAASPRFRRFP